MIITGAGREATSTIMDFEQHLISQVIEAAAKPLLPRSRTRWSRSDAAAAGPADHIFLDFGTLAGLRSHGAMFAGPGF